MSTTEIRALLLKATQDRPAGITLAPAPAPRRARVLVPALASLGVAAAIGLGVVGLPGAEASAQALVAQAADNTSKESFKIHSVSSPKTFQGAFDPVKRVGWFTSSAGTQTRFIGDLMYIREGSGKWRVYPRESVKANDIPDAVRLIKLAPLDPQQALQQLRQATDVRKAGPASGNNWTGTRYTFELGGKSDADGSVEVDSDGRVRTLAMTFADGHVTTEHFTDFGTPVTVTAPPANQIEQGSDPSADKSKPPEGKTPEQKNNKS